MFKKSYDNINPKIISRLINGVPYYEIEYFDKSKNEICVGFGSYTRSFVEEWLKTEFY